MDPAPSLPRRGRQHVHERGHVVVGDALALVDLLDREARRANRLQLAFIGPLVAEQASQLLAGRHLDLAPGLHARLIGPQPA